MEGQYCLKWNNHHSTLISVLDSLLGSGKHVDCTLAAEGRELGAHKVVLSACSPYLESLLNKPSEKHPIIIFNDVKYDELKAILEYMYRGEVNVLQEQLARFLKAAEALQIKGLTDQGGGGGGGSNDNDHRGAGNIESLASNQIGGKYKHASETSSEDTTTPSRNMRQEDHAPNRRKRQRRMSQEKLSSDNNIDSSNSCDTILSAPITATTAVHSQPTSVTKIETDRLSSPMVQQQHNTSAPPTTAVLIKPKSEYFEDPNSQDKFIEDLTLDDDEEVSRYSAKPGPSHADTQGKYQTNDVLCRIIDQLSKIFVGKNNFHQGLLYQNFLLVDNIQLKSK
ncbi:hypothetical protein AAG570_013850 [Ranatra chinensis]|uniref:BTB domain-containing protein n=1 Tax=Ranatra chinensis TaxID=642074 RepID=A0ABD0YDN2_9HEMI